MKHFQELGLSPVLNTSLSAMGYDAPTPIQAKAIPLALQGRDILGSAQTGTGKTAAFCIPMIETLLQQDEGSALVLTPTRELAKQVLDVVHQLLGRDGNMNTAFIIGGDPMHKQLAQLKKNPRIIVGTPGRVNDHLQRKTLKLNKTGFLVLDETDRMLDMGFGVQLDKIAAYLPETRQTLMFSATMPREIIKLSGKYLNNPERIAIGDSNVIAKNIKQETVHIEQGEKYKELMSQLRERDGSVIVFVKTKHNADRMAKNLRQDGFTSEALHGDLRQNRRDKVMKNFRSQNFRVLIATDIAARGLDVPHIEHVINYDLPQVAEDYIHRMGRTARAGATGSAVSFIASQDGRKWKAIERLLDPNIANDRDEGPRVDGRGRKRRPFKNKGFGNKGAAGKSFKKKNDFRAGGNTEGQETRSNAKPGQKKPFKKSNDQRGKGQSEGQKAKTNHGKPFRSKDDTRRDDTKRSRPSSGKPHGKNNVKSRDDRRGKPQTNTVKTGPKKPTPSKGFRKGTPRKAA